MRLLKIRLIFSFLSNKPELGICLLTALKAFCKNASGADIEPLGRLSTDGLPAAAFQN